MRNGDFNPNLLKFTSITLVWAVYYIIMNGCLKLGGNLVLERIGDFETLSDSDNYKMKSIFILVKELPNILSH